jgi:hypothetical protein
MSSLLSSAKATSRRWYQATTGPIRLKPDFIIIGVARGGTTSLYNYLIDHPNIRPAAAKEVHFFDNQFYKGKYWYQGQFPYTIQKYYAENVRKEKFLTGEASPYYIYHPYAASRIAEALPQVKLVLLLRNPVERAYSHYSWEVSWGTETLSFEEAIEREQARIATEIPRLATQYGFNHQHFSYVTRGHYAEQIQIWFKHFSRDQFLILKSEDMYKEPAGIYKQIIEFLELPIAEQKVAGREFKQYNQPEQRKSGVPFTPKKISPETRQRLIEYYRPHNDRLYELLGRDFAWV